MSWGKTLWVGKRSWKSRSDDKKMNKLKHANMLSSVILQKIVARKGSSQVSLRNHSKKGEPEYIRSRAEKTFRKHQKIIADDEHDTSQINDFHAFKQLLFIFIILFAYFGYAGSSLLSAAFSGCGRQGLLSS